MNKNIKLLALSSLLVMPVVASAANVEIYGDLRSSINSNDDGNTSTLVVSSNKSRFGFRGDVSLDVKNTSLIWQVENEISLDKGGDYKGRNTYIGLKGDFGQLRIGKHATPYKYLTSKADVFKDTVADNSALIGNFNGKKTLDNRLDNSIVYISPKMSGFSLSAAYVPDETGGEKDVYSFNGNLKVGAWNIGAAFETLNDATGAGMDKSGSAFIVRYALTQNTMVNFVWENLEDGGAVNDRDAAYLAIAHQSGRLGINVAIGQASNVGKNTDTGAGYIAVGVSNALSKSVEIYGLYVQVANDASARYGLEQLKASAAGADTSSLSVGLNYKFSTK